MTKVRQWTRTWSEWCAGSTAPSPQRVGALNDRYLARDRTLGEARLLWEIGADRGLDVRRLRERLELDSGYVSRLLRSLEAAGLVTVATPGPGTAGSAPPGSPPRAAAERAVLDEPQRRAGRVHARTAQPRQRHRLVAAMAEVDRLLSAATGRRWTPSTRTAPERAGTA